MPPKITHTLLLCSFAFFLHANVIAAPTPTMQAHQRYSIELPEARLENIHRIAFPTSDLEQLLVFVNATDEDDSSSKSEPDKSELDKSEPDAAEQAAPGNNPMTAIESLKAIRSLSDRSVGNRIFDFTTEKFISLSRYRRNNKLPHRKLWSRFPDIPIPTFYRAAVKHALAYNLRSDHQCLIRIDTPQSLRLFHGESAMSASDIFSDAPPPPSDTKHYIFSVYDSNDLFKPELISRFQLQTALSNPQITFSKNNTFILSFDDSKRLAIIDLPKRNPIDLSRTSFDYPHPQDLESQTADWPEPHMTVISFENEKPILLHQPDHGVDAHPHADQGVRKEYQAYFEGSVLAHFFSGSITSAARLANTDPVPERPSPLPLAAQAILGKTLFFATYNPQTTCIELNQLDLPLTDVIEIDPKIMTRRISSRNIQSVDMQSVHGRFLLTAIEYMTPLHANRKQLVLIVDTNPAHGRPEVIWTSELQDEILQSVTVDQVGGRVAFIRGSRLALDYLKPFESLAFDPQTAQPTGQAPVQGGDENQGESRERTGGEAGGEAGGGIGGETGGEIEGGDRRGQGRDDLKEDARKRGMILRR